MVYLTYQRMPYTVNQLAKIAGVSVRTLHHYDQVGLLSPSRAAKNGYRLYEEKELLLLQQILFFRELEFPLEEIGKILSSPGFDMRAALADHRKLIVMRRSRLNGLLRTVDDTIKKLDNKKDMQDEQLYENFSEDDYRKYMDEAKQKWGDTQAWKQSQERTKNFKKEDWDKLKEDGVAFMKKWAAAKEAGEDIKGPVAQSLVDEQYAGLRLFYEPNVPMFRNLASMYVDDQRFADNYDKYTPGLAIFVRDAIHHWCDRKEARA